MQDDPKLRKKLSEAHEKAEAILRVAGEQGVVDEIFQKIEYALVSELAKPGWMFSRWRRVFTIRAELLAFRAVKKAIDNILKGGVEAGVIAKTLDGQKKPPK